MIYIERPGFRDEIIIRRHRVHDPSAFAFSLMLNSALYWLLACCAFLASTVEKQVGHDKLCRHHQIVAVLYALLGAVQMLHL